MKTWQDDARAFLETCREMHVPAALERSRSGNGGQHLDFLRPSNLRRDRAKTRMPSPSRKRPDKPITEPLPEQVRIVRGNLLYIEKANLPSAMLNRLIRAAAFQNPEFYRAQAMRLSTFGKPRVICCAEEFGRHLGLPWGCLEDVLALLRSHNIKADLVDERFVGEGINVSFCGTLRPLKQMAVAAMQPYDDGVSGKK